MSRGLSTAVRRAITMGGYSVGCVRVCVLEREREYKPVRYLSSLHFLLVTFCYATKTGTIFDAILVTVSVLTVNVVKL